MNTKMCVLIFSTTFTWNISHSKNNCRDANVHGSSRKVLVILVWVQRNLNFLQRFSKNTQISNFMKFRPVGPDLFHADRHTDRQDEPKAGETLSSRHVSSCDVNACSWDVRSEFYGADSHFCHSAYATWSHVKLWSAHVPARLSNFCFRTHFVRRDVRVERSSDVTSCFQKWRKCLLKKRANGPFYMTPSH